jgi:uncharacterized delta-60 repeat protein
MNIRRNIFTVGAYFLSFTSLLAHDNVSAAPGDLDKTFSKDGKELTDFSGITGFDGATSVVVQNDGELVVGGFSLGARDHDFALARYKKDGTLDGSFGNQGKVITDISPGQGSADFDQIYVLALQKDGKIIAAGVSKRSLDDKDFALARYNRNGTLDKSFGGDGIVTTNFCKDCRDQINAIAIQKDGKILAVGASPALPLQGLNDFAIARYNKDGTLDKKFSGDGKLLHNFGGFEEARGVAVQKDGKIVVGGSGTPTGQRPDFIVARYKSNGLPDKTFGKTGKVITDLGAGEQLFGLALQPDGKIVVTGETTDGITFFFAVARYKPSGALDKSFDKDGVLAANLFPSFADRPRAIALQPDGKILVAGQGASSRPGATADFALVRFNTNGKLDKAFSGDGKLLTNFTAPPFFTSGSDSAHAIALQADGKIVVAGNSSANGGNDDFAVARYRK